MASPEVWEEMSGGDMSTAGEASIVAGIGVDVDITPPTNTVRIGKVQKEELVGMRNELKRKFHEGLRKTGQLGQDPKLKKVRLKCVFCCGACSSILKPIRRH